MFHIYLWKKYSWTKYNHFMSYKLLRKGLQKLSKIGFHKSYDNNFIEKSLPYPKREFLLSFLFDPSCDEKVITPKTAVFSV